MDKEKNLLLHVFEKYDGDGYLRPEQFNKFIIDLLFHLFETIDSQVIRAVFDYIDTDGNGLLKFQEVYDWWLSPKRFNFFAEENIALVKKAHNLFLRYTTRGRRMTFKEFEKFLSDMKLSHHESVFDRLDLDGDGLMNFSEFLIGWIGFTKLVDIFISRKMI